jgi:glycosyltransferase involved in cell wall biosynthesis
LKVLHIIPSFYPATNFGGPVYSGYSLCNALARQPGIELRVLTTDSNGPMVGDRVAVEASPVRFPAGYEVYYDRHLWATALAPAMLRRLWSMIKWADVVHLTSVYSPPTIPTLLICKALKKPVVWSTRGMLQHWGGTTRKRVKSAWERMCNLLCDRQRVVMHVTSEEERRASLEHIDRASAEVIPNGIDLPETGAGRVWQPSERTRLLYLGRLDPIKGIENLLHAVARVDERVTLAICGDGDERYEKSLEALTRSLSLCDRVSFHGKVTGEEKLSCFREADVCVVPSHRENFCMVVAESLAQGVPVIASRGTPWREVENIGCGMWVENDPASLAGAIERISSMPLNVMGERGRAWMEREFSWADVAERMSSLYERLAPQAAVSSDKAK